ncbi:MAG: hypothetical protein AAAFM81_07600 [Pseudomonadota bacterium]
MNKFQFSIVLMIGSGLLSGCSESLPPAPEQSLAEAKIAARTVSEASIGKPTVPVVVDYAFLNTPTVDQPLQIRMSVSGRDVSNLTMAMSTRGELALSKNTPASMPLKMGATTGAAEAVDTYVTPSAEGRSYVNVQISGLYENQPFTKAISIPVQVGAGGPVLEKNGEIIDTGVEILSSMPASQQVSKGEQ